MVKVMRWAQGGGEGAGDREQGKLGLRTASEFNWQTKALEGRQRGRQRVPTAAAT